MTTGDEFLGATKARLHGLETRMDKVEEAVARVELAAASVKGWIAGALFVATAAGGVIGFLIRLVR